MSQPIDRKAKSPLRNLRIHDSTLTFVEKNSGRFGLRSHRRVQKSAVARERKHEPCSESDSDASAQKNGNSDRAELSYAECECNTEHSQSEECCFGAEIR